MIFGPAKSHDPSLSPSAGAGRNGAHDVSSSPDPAAALTLRLLDELTGDQPLRSLHFRLWDGTSWPDASPRPATLVLNRPSALREMLAGGSEVALAEAYLHEAFDVEGDCVAAFELGDLLMARTRGWTRTLRLAADLHRLPDPAREARHLRQARLDGEVNSADRDRHAVRFHYDVSNHFYSLWLDPRMVYSCAYFANPATPLEEAQVRKLDHICRKLGLRPGERLLEIGCGWGGLLLHAATHYGVEAEGITLSERQHEWVGRLIRERNLQDRVRVHLRDYRDLPADAAYDKAVSVGMVEHVGRKNLPLYFRQIFGLLRPGGLFLNHGIGAGPIHRPNEGEDFIQRYVFPDTDLPPIGHMLGAAETERWEVRDVESLREHYALTLRHWVRRLEARHGEAAAELGEQAYRIWRLYMAGSAHGFERGYLSIYQALLAKPEADGRSAAPLTRDGWYVPAVS